MSKISIHTKLLNVPATFEMVSPRIQQQRIKPDPYGQPAANRIVLQNDEMVVRLHLHDRLSSREMKRLVDRMQVREPEPIRLGDPVMAIEIIHPGCGWPDESGSGPVSILDYLPVWDWLTMQSQRPVSSLNDEWFGAPGKLQFNDAQPGSQPVQLHYDSIIGVNQHGCRVFVTVNSRFKNELVGDAVIEVAGQEAASKLAEALRCRQVRCLKANGVVGRILLFPHVSICTNQNRETFVEQTYVDITACPGDGKSSLLTLARWADPDLVTSHAAVMGC